MYIKILLNYILGYVNILVEGFFTERFINTCINKNIFLFNIIKMRKNAIVSATKVICPHNNDYTKHEIMDCDPYILDERAHGK